MRFRKVFFSVLPLELGGHVCRIMCKRMYVVAAYMMIESEHQTFGKPQICMKEEVTFVSHPGSITWQRSFFGSLLELPVQFSDRFS